MPRNSKRVTSFVVLILLLASIHVYPQNQKFGIVIHGGAGTILKKDMSPEKEKEYTEKLTEALEAGYKILESGGSSLDAVEQAIRIMEDSPLFNAGKGAVFTNAGTNELDASIMDGKTLAAGAVAGIKHVKNPITLARKVMENSPHVMMTGEGAETFAKKQNLEIVDQSYFFTKERWESLQKAKQEEKLKEKHGTVGAVAIDIYGNISAGTSTGGMTNKKWGRVGDSPIIGAGTYANNNTCGVSATGHGEYFIRLGAAKDVSALMEYKGMSLASAAEEVIFKKLTELGGTGGVVALDKDLNVAMIFNTEGMFRGYYLSGCEPVVKIYKE